MSEYYVPKNPADPTAGKIDPVNISVFGQTIPLMFGAARILCAPIWAGNVITNEDGSRIVTAAFMAGKRDPIAVTAQVLRIWMDGVLAYTNDGSPVNSPQQLDFTFHDGSETQGIDPTIAAVEGADRTPAFRDRMYLVVRNWNIPVGAKFPELTVEIVQTVNADTGRYITPYGGNSYDFEGSATFGLYFFVAIEQDILWTLDRVTRHVQAYSISLQALVTDFLPQFPGAIEAYPITSSRNRPETYHVQPSGGTLIGTWNQYGTQLTQCTGANGYAAVSWRVNFGDEYLAMLETSALQLYRRTSKGGEQLLPISTARVTFSGGINCPPVFIDHRNFVAESASGGYVACYYAYDKKIGLMFYPFDEDGKAVVGYQPQANGFKAFTQGYFAGDCIVDLSGIPGDFISLLFLDPTGAYLYALVGGNLQNAQWVKMETVWGRLISGVSGTPVRPLIALATLNIVETVDLGFHIVLHNTEFTAIQGTPQGQHKLPFVDATNFTPPINLVDMSNGTYVTYPRGTFHLASDHTIVIDDSTSTQFDGRMTWDSKNQGAYYLQMKGALYRPGFVSMIDAANGDGALSLGNYFTSLAVLAGFDTSEIDATGVTDTIDGSIINVSTTFLTLASKVAQLFRVDILESEGKIKFFRHSRGLTVTADRTLTIDELCLLKQGDLNDGSVLQKDRDKTQDLPQTLQVTYLDSQNDFEIGGQVARRTQFPFRTTAGTGTLVIDVPLAMKTNDALYWAEYALYDMWAEALKVTARGTQAQLDLEPGDWIDFSTDDDGEYLVKLNEVQINADMSLNLIGTSVLSITPANPNIPIIDTKSDVVLPTVPNYPIKVAVIDNFTPVDQAGGETVASLLVYAQSVSDHKMLLADGITQSNGRVEFPAIFGALLVAMPTLVYADTPLTDVTIKGRFSSPPPAGTDATFLDGSSAVAVGTPGNWELIYFRDVTDNGDGTHTLSYLARGRRGTDIVTPALVGQTIVVLNDANPIRFPYPLASLGTEGQMFSQYVGRNIYTGVLSQLAFKGGDLKPWAPIHVAAASASGNVIITWDRRDRHQTAMTDGSSATYLSETTEAYDLEIINPADGTVKRTVSGLTSPTYTYTSSQIAADGLTVTAFITLRIYQLSSTVGRGYGRNVVCPVS